MCLAIPMRIMEMEGDKAVVEAGGIRKEVRLDLIDSAEMGDYVLIHTGYAIEKLDKTEALETLELIKQVYRAGMTHDPESGSGS
ncbi:MAG: HypC/HybG/HupF family hydrogenase formation chaperone [Bacteroidales bacterium]|nr:HypC/HybG/HupF family hydrogenase formation chaperone [Candidatus Latescibacterota bacterium]